MPETSEILKKAVMIGAGNVAFHLAPVLEKAGLRFVQVYSRTAVHARQLASRLAGCRAIDELEDLDPTAEWYFIAVTDAALQQIALHLRLPGKKVVHVSGSVPLSVLDPVSEHAGVMYFFQTFSKEAACPDMASVPLCIEASDLRFKEELKALGARISRKVAELDSRQRALLHLGGVFACNYVNFMYTVAYRLLQHGDMDFSLLHPLMRETLRKAVSGPDPASFQTGPAARGDKTVMDRHRSLLGRIPSMERWGGLYDCIAREILHDRDTERSGSFSGIRIPSENPAVSDSLSAETHPDAALSSPTIE